MSDTDTGARGMMCAECGRLLDRSDSTASQYAVCKECLREFRKEMGMIVVEKEYSIDCKSVD